MAGVGVWACGHRGVQKALPPMSLTRWSREEAVFCGGQWLAWWSALGMGLGTGAGMGVGMGWTEVVVYFWFWFLFSLFAYVREGHGVNGWYPSFRRQR